MAKKKTPEEVSEEFMGFVKHQFELQQKILEKTYYDIRDLRQGQLLHDKRFDSIEQTLRAVSYAVDKDAVKVIDHERRLSRLEIRSK